MMKAGRGSRLYGKFGMVLAVLVAIGIAIFAVRPGAIRDLLRMDPARMDYTWLRDGLDQAAEAADITLASARQGGTVAAADTLESAIVYSRANARRTGTHPIPRHIREQLKDFFPAYVLDKVRWTYPSRDLDLGSAVAAWYRAHGGAVTLEDTIVYSNSRAVNMRYLWAHELTHVMQYEELGLKDFARVYATNPQLLERQAWDNAKQIVFALQRSEREAAKAANAPPPSDEETLGEPVETPAHPGEPEAEITAPENERPADKI